MGPDSLQDPAHGTAPSSAALDVCVAGSRAFVMQAIQCSGREPGDRCHSGLEGPSGALRKPQNWIELSTAVVTPCSGCSLKVHLSYNLNCLKGDYVLLCLPACLPARPGVRVRAPPRAMICASLALPSPYFQTSPASLMLNNSIVVWYNILRSFYMRGLGGVNAVQECLCKHRWVRHETGLTKLV